MGMKIIGLMIALGLTACTQGHCRRKSETPKAAAPVESTEQAAQAPATKGSERTFVYKYDGSLQCGMGKAVPLDVMAKELTSVPILSSVKKRDGLMHIQVCGSITGMANVYEIPTKNLKQAEAKGFKKWSFE